MTLARKASYALFALITIGAIAFDLDPFILASLFSFMILDTTHRRLAKVVGLSPTGARWISLGVFLIAASLISTMFVRFVKQTLATAPKIASEAVPKVVAIADSYGIDLPFDSPSELRDVVVKSIQSGASPLTKAGSVLTRDAFHVLIGLFVAIFCFMGGGTPPRYGPSLFDTLRREFDDRMRTFMLGFERVMGAQILISGINTTFTAIFLFAMDFPHKKSFLIPATFILGIIPVVGNILSNILIVGAGLTVSPRHAVFALGFLVVIHKGEYFLNSRIMGSSIRAPMWQTLIAILVGEVVMGVPGIILAPAMLYYIKDELQHIPAQG